MQSMTSRTHFLIVNNYADTWTIHSQRLHNDIKFARCWLYVHTWILWIFSRNRKFLWNSMYRFCRVVPSERNFNVLVYKTGYNVNKGTDYTETIWIADLFIYIYPLQYFEMIWINLHLFGKVYKNSKILKWSFVTMM